MLVVYRVSDPRWTAPRAPNEVLGPLVGRRVEALERRGKYLIAQFEDELFLLMHLRMTGNLLYDAEPSAPYTRAIMGFDDEHTLSFVDPRRFGTGWLLAGEPELDAYLDARLGVEPFSRGLQRRASARARARLARAGQGVPARPEADRGRRQHLRRRGAVPRAGPSAARGRQTHARPVGAAARHRPRGAAGGDRRERRDDRRLPRPRRRARLVPGPLPRAPPRRRAVPALRRAGAQAARRRPRHVRLRALPAAPARRADRADEPLSSACRPRVLRRPRPAALLGQLDRLLEGAGPQRRVALERLVLRPLLAPLRELALRLAVAQQPVERVEPARRRAPAGRPGPRRSRRRGRSRRRATARPRSRTPSA